MSVTKTRVAIFASLVSLCSLSAEQSFILTDFPISPMRGVTAVWVKWAGVSIGVPDSGSIYFSTSPGGGVRENYPNSVTVFAAESTFAGLDAKGDTTWDIKHQSNMVDLGGVPQQRGSKFRPCDQSGMGPGVYYYVVANKTDYSNELQMIVEADTGVELTSPKPDSVLEGLTPTFEWGKNPGVPYYHVIISDKEIVIEEGDSINLTGLSIIWQAITPGYQITYGTPDPSGTITADPPPLSPGQTYTWIVLNNYGNHPAFTSTVPTLPRKFTIQEYSTPLPTPVNLWPPDSATLTVSDDPTVTFRWSHDPSDSQVNTYKVYVYVSSDEYENIDAQLVLWNDEITAGDFSGDFAEVTVDAQSIFTNNYYTWKVIAVDCRGAGMAGAASGFRYRAPFGEIYVKTAERIPTQGTVLTKPVSLVEVQVKVLKGSMEAPLLWYTENDGELCRERPEGTYRLTAVKNGFESQTRTITLVKDRIDSTIFYLERPDATVYGKVIDDVGSAIGLATVVGVSERGDTATAETDPLGNFILPCYEADWRIMARKEGFVTSLPRDTSVSFGENIDFGAIALRENSYTLFGSVKNAADEPLLGVKVELLKDGVIIGTVPSTPQTGRYSFAVESGTYRLTATKVGFASFSESIDVLSTTEFGVTMASGAALVKGTIVGRMWAGDSLIYAPITGASVSLIDTVEHDTLTTVSDDVYGDFSMSVPGGKEYLLYSDAEGFEGRMRSKSILTLSGKTRVETDTLDGLATVRGVARVSGSDSTVSDVTVSFINTETGVIAATGQTDAVGAYEIRNVPNALLVVQAGRSGYCLESVQLVGLSGSPVSSDTMRVSEGHAVKEENTGTRVLDSINVSMAIGTQSIVWALTHGGADVTGAVVKVQSPLRATVAAGNTLHGVGIGTYVLAVDAEADSLLDVALHRFTILQSQSADTPHVDSVELALVHNAADTLEPEDGTVLLSLAAQGEALASAQVFFRSVGSPLFDSLAYSSVDSGGGTYTYRFDVTPRRDATHMEYFFRAARGADVYGYEQETFLSYVRSDPNTITRLELCPSWADTLLLPAGAEVEFVLRGYYSSSFLPVTHMVDDNVNWSLANPSGCSLSDGSDGLSVTLRTPASGTGEDVVRLRAVFKESELYHLSPGIGDTVSVFIVVSDGGLGSVFVVRIDPGTGPITTSALDKAEFRAQGVDTDGRTVVASASWFVRPEGAGSIENGIFRPISDFVGFVRIYAEAGGIRGEYNALTGPDSRKSGLEVEYVVTSAADTVSDLSACTIEIPENSVTGGQAMLSMVTAYMEGNRSWRAFKPSDAHFQVIGEAYDIGLSLDAGASLDTSASFVLRIDIPEEFEEEAMSSVGLERYKIAIWNDGLLWWEVDEGAELADDGGAVTLATKHFSRYAIARESKRGVKWSIKPNPFSPFVKPVDDYGLNAPFGACIRVIAETTCGGDTVSQECTLERLRVGIYNVVGEEAWSVLLQQPTSGRPYEFWWDGRTTRKGGVALNCDDKNPGADGQASTFSGSDIETNRLCRNGRYFVVLEVEDGSWKKQEVKQIILLK